MDDTDIDNAMTISQPIERETALAPAESKAIAAPKDPAMDKYRTMFQVAGALYRSGLVPKQFRNVDQAFYAIATGNELGMGPAASLANFGIINGKLGLYGDGVKALCDRTGQVESWEVEDIGEEGKETRGVRVTIKRKGVDSPFVGEFTVEKAKRAGLWNKSGPWTQYPDRMLMWRAWHFAARAAFPDALLGVPGYEELRDIPNNEHDAGVDPDTGVLDTELMEQS